MRRGLGLEGSLDEVVKLSAHYEVHNIISHDGDLEDVFLDLARLGQHFKCLVTVAGDENIIECLGLSTLGDDLDAIAISADGPHRGTETYPVPVPVNKARHVFA